jgi:hypothetical protein
MDKNRIISIVIILIVSSIFLYGCTNENKETKEDMIKIKLIDSLTKNPISDVNVTIYSDNGIRCIRAPCPTEGQEWIGKSDGKGVIFIPSSLVNNVITIDIGGYSGKNIQNDLKNLTVSNLEIYLDSDSTYELKRKCKWIPGMCKNNCDSQNYYFDSDFNGCRKYIEENVPKGCCTPPPFDTQEECERICS